MYKAKFIAHESAVTKQLQLQTVEDIAPFAESHTSEAIHCPT
jgi:hypothetical protein